MLKKICILLGLLCLLVSCAPKVEPPIPTPPAKPLGAAPKIVYDTTDYPAMMDSLFDTAAVPADADMQVTVADGKATLKSYLGSATAVKIPETVGGLPMTAVDDKAFADNTTLEILVLPESLEAVGKEILSGCSGLRALYTPMLGGGGEGQGFLGYLFGSSTHLDNSRDVPASLELVRLGKRVTDVGDYAFYDCNDLIAVDAAGAVTSFGTFAFFGCTHIKHLPLADLVTLGEGAMGRCRSLVQVVLPATLTSVGIGALSECHALADLTLPFVGGGTAETGFLGYVFGAEVVDHASGCYPSKLQKVTVLEGCTALENYAFFECDSLRSISLPGGITSIGIRAFADCDSLASVTLPDSVVSLGENCFAGCDYLQTVSLGAGLKSLGVNAFLNCVSLAEISLPGGVEALPPSCFANCVSLKKAALGNVKTVGAMAFRNCNALEIVTGGEVSFEKGNDLAEDLLNK